MSALDKYCKSKKMETPKSVTEETDHIHTDDFEVPEEGGHKDEFKGNVEKWKKKAKMMEMHK